MMFHYLDRIIAKKEKKKKESNKITPENTTDWGKEIFLVIEIGN